MRRLDARIIKEYYSIIKEQSASKWITNSDLLNPSDEMLNIFIEMFFKNIKTFSMEEAKRQLEKKDKTENDSTFDEELESIIEDKGFKLCTEVLEDILVYVISTDYKDGKDLLEYILNTDIDIVVKELNSNLNFARLALKYYLKYLVSKSEFIISTDQENLIWESHRFLGRLIENRGYSTLNDTARNVLMDLYFDIANASAEMEDYELVDIPTVERVDETFCSYFDEMLASNIRNIYFKQNGIDTSNKEYMEMIKKRIIRVILADAYLDMKIADFEAEDEDGTLSEEETDALEFIENCAYDDNYSLPEDSKLRTIIYRHFFYYNSNGKVSRRDDMGVLSEYDDVKVISKINPLCYLD